MITVFSATVNLRHSGHSSTGFDRYNEDFSLLISSPRSAAILFYCRALPVYDILRIMAPAATKKRSLLGILNVLVITGILLVGLWPLNFKPVNKVEWIGTGNGIRFYGQGLVYSDIFSNTSNAFQTGSTSIELWIRPTTNANRSIARILSLHDGLDEKFSIGQWQSHLILQSKIRDGNDRGSYRRISLDKVLTRNSDRFVTITSGPKGTAIYLDGVLARTFPRFVPFSANRKTAGYLVLGNSATGDQYWTGELLGLAAYNRSLTSDQIMRNHLTWKKKGLPLLSAKEGLIALYRFDERTGTMARNHMRDDRHLQIPAGFPLLQKIVLSSPWKDFRMRRAYFKDVAINIAGFAPFGFFLAAYLLNTTSLSKMRIYFLTAFAGAGISLFIELSQAWLPTRSSSLTDLICNLLGTVLGTIIFHVSRAFLIIHRSSSKYHGG